jgi:hypothetical protein
LSLGKQIARWGAGVFAGGLGVFVYFSFFNAPYAGASGAGLAGLGAGLAVLGAMMAMGLGALIALIGFIVWRLKGRQKPL